ncbi:MFS transporter [Gloeocapsa sp. PCC 73106]|uniref:MFS transporter n=1 Tax=Gloeocapsa sp. PCC 73106 TaxID=102232 RepID=UPI0002AD0A52|nr:MFS transporter [Gloeocapsa sp. PCC 73106]ELR98278.1 arabinose efflux permease family protein [Gloeocapsa sp. PCC 73106]
MRTFTIIWLGQIVSTIGSFMTVFALTIWVWQQNASVTDLTLFTFFSQLPRIFVTPFAGIIVDRFSRKNLMLLGDIMAFLCTSLVALLYFSGSLQIWHLYAVVALYGCFGQIQILAYSTSISSLVDKADYTRAESMVAAIGYGSAIIAPALAGTLISIIGLRGIILIDLTSFLAAIATLLSVEIPRPQTTLIEPEESTWQKLTFGFRYIASKPPLIAMVIAFSLFAFPSDIGKSLYSPLILARTGGDAQILGNVTTAAGLGGVLGAVLLSFWGGFRRRIQGMLLGFIGTSFFKIILGLGQTSLIWIGAHFTSALFIPLFYSSSNAIWYSKVPPAIQGRVLAADQMIGLVIIAIASLISGPLVDRFFEPMMQTDSGLATLFGPIVGTEPGSGIALVYVFTSLCSMLVGIGGYWFRTLRDVEKLLPDHN